MFCCEPDPIYLDTRVNGEIPASLLMRLDRRDYAAKSIPSSSRTWSDKAQIVRVRFIFIAEPTTKLSTPHRGECLSHNLLTGRVTPLEGTLVA